jgi:hypothetical protein
MRQRRDGGNQRHNDRQCQLHKRISFVWEAGVRSAGAKNPKMVIPTLTGFEICANNPQQDLLNLSALIMPSEIQCRDAHGSEHRHDVQAAPHLGYQTPTHWGVVLYGG